MNTFTNNLTAADTVARQLIQERVQDAELVGVEHELLSAADARAAINPTP